MKKKLLELLRGFGLIGAAVVMMAIGVGFILLIAAVFHTNFK